MSLMGNNTANTGMYYRYFVFSSEEEALRQQIHGVNANFGTVIVRGVAKRYTSIVSDMKDAKSDAIIITKGEIRKIKYNPPQKNK